MSEAWSSFFCKKPGESDGLPRLGQPRLELFSRHTRDLAAPPGGVGLFEPIEHRVCVRYLNNERSYILPPPTACSHAALLLTACPAKPGNASSAGPGAAACSTRCGLAAHADRVRETLFNWLGRT
jgi:hypothetical protein